MFVIDDLLVRPLMSVAKVVHAVAMEELYDTERIQNDLKENQLLYDIGERSEAEYRRRKEELETELDVAERALEILDDDRVQVLD